MSKYKDCPVCGRKFEFCGRCKRVSFDNLWRNIYCSIECRDIFDTCRKFIGGSLSIQDAYDILTKSKVKEKNLQMSVKNTVDKIMEYKPQEKEEKVVVEKERVVEEKPVQRRSRRRKPKVTEE